jgi:hypothetical protein
MVEELVARFPKALAFATGNFRETEREREREREKRIFVPVRALLN